MAAQSVAMSEHGEFTRRLSWADSLSLGLSIPVGGFAAGYSIVWVPETVSPHATCVYSWIRPPSRSRRRTRILVTSAGGCARPAGGFCCSARCGRCVS
jgi:hypothetical protein